MQGLDAVHERRAVRLRQQVATHLHHVVGTDAEEVAVERRVVELAQRSVYADQDGSGA